jgi:5-methylcytosine-specific restriction enzyme subunit McrC
MQDNKIIWRNIYYMLTYAIDELAYMKIGDAEIDDCKTLDELLAALMIKAIELLYKNNYLNDYNRITGITDKVKGTILIDKTYNSGVIALGKVYCKYFVLNINSKPNIIIKSAITCLLRHGEISRERRFILNNIVEDLNNVADIDAMELDFEDLEYYLLPDWYKPAIVVSKLIVKNLLGMDKFGKVRLFVLDDEERLKYIFEEFVRNFYMQEYKDGKTTQPVYKVSETSKNKLDMLIENDKRALIIDTKWYQSKNIYNNRRANIREIIDYIISYKENEVDTRKETFGVVLYARTNANANVLNEEELRSLGKDYGECLICERTLDLNQEFEDIKNDLKDLADEFLEYR